jgi:nanoRNase/pAp phosphatase (c-di-AMP/oligoRNAs hydrolase)
VVGPSQPVDGDSVACTKALILHLRKQGLEAFTLPTITMFSQIDWILGNEDIHPSALEFTGGKRVTGDLQGAYDALIAKWLPDEIIVVDGQANRIGFDTRGVKVYTIDHHVKPDVRQDDENGFVQPAPAAGCLLIERFGIMEPILVVSILTDTFWLRHHEPSRATRALAELTRHGLDNELFEDYQRKLRTRKNPLILEELKRAVVRTSPNEEAVFVVLATDDPEIHRGVMGELGYFYRHIATVRGDGYVSLVTVDPHVDLRDLVAQFANYGSAGGHKDSAAISFASIDDTLIEALSAAYFAFIGDHVAGRQPKGDS